MLHLSQGCRAYKMGSGSCARVFTVLRSGQASRFPSPSSPWAASTHILSLCDTPIVPIWHTYCPFMSMWHTYCPYMTHTLSLYDLFHGKGLYDTLCYSRVIRLLGLWGGQDCRSKQKMARITSSSSTSDAVFCLKAIGVILRDANKKFRNLKYFSIQ